MQQHLPDSLDEFYAELEARWSVTTDSSLGDLVVPNGNSRAPVHRWFPMKEAFSLDLLPRMLDELGIEGGVLSLLDPYCGGGTSGVSAAKVAAREGWDRVDFVGCESNPFLHLVSSAKLGALIDPSGEFESLAQRTAAAALNGVPAAEMPSLSTFEREDYLERSHLEELLKIKSAIELEAAAGMPQEAIDLASLCLASAIEPATKLRKDGRALRYEPEKTTQRPLKAYLDMAANVIEDLPLSPSRLEGSVELADSRLDVTCEPESRDLVIFSPPYPNNIDYTEVYKLELWLLGFVADEVGFADQRRRTVRSHASLKFDEPAGLHPDAAKAIEELIEPVVNAVPSGNRYASARRRMVRQYATDMLSSFLKFEEIMKPGASLIYAVGDSVHGSASSGSFVIAADLMLAAIAERAGLIVDEIRIARRPSRRSTSSPFLRESVVTAHKSHG